MKILFLSDHFPPDIHGGYEIGCSLAAQGLAKKNHDVTVLTTRSAYQDIIQRNYRIIRSLPPSDVPIRSRILLVFTRIIREFHSAFILNQFFKTEKFDLIYVWCPHAFFMTTIQIIYRQKTPVCYYLFDRWFSELEKMRNYDFC